jgi:hypothetical protein
MKQIKGFEDYLITLDGRIFSLKTMMFLKNFIKSDYVYVKIKNKSHRVHRLVASTYLPNPENKATVNHLDGNKHNNMLCNLEWATSSENMKHACDTGLRPVSDLMRENGKRMTVNLHIGRNSYITKLVLNEENGIYYESATDAAESIGVKPNYLWRRLNGEIKNNTNFKYV